MPVDAYGPPNRYPRTGTPRVQGPGPGKTGLLGTLMAWVSHYDLLSSAVFSRLFGGAIQASIVAKLMDASGNAFLLRSSALNVCF